MTVNYKLTDEQVLEVRAIIAKDMAGKNVITAKEICANYGVADNTIINAVRGKSYGHLPNAIPNAFKRGSNLTPRSPLIPYDYILLMLNNRNKNPLFWTYAELAKQCNLRHKTKYTGSNVQRLLTTYASKNNLKIEKAPEAVKISAKSVKCTRANKKETIPPWRRKQLAEKLFYLRSNNLI